MKCSLDFLLVASFGRDQAREHLVARQHTVGVGDTLVHRRVWVLLLLLLVL